MQCVANTLFLTLEQVFGRTKSLSVYRSTSMLTCRKVFFCMNILYPHRKLLLYHSKEELPRLGALARYSVWSEHRACLSISQSQVTGEAIAVGSHFLRSYPIHGVTPRDLNAGDAWRKQRVKTVQ